MPRSPENSQYYCVAQALRRAIDRGIYGPNANLPPVRELAELYSCSVFTIHRAVKLLKDEGIVTSRQGSGVLVCGDVRGGPQRILLVVPDWSYGAHGAARHYGGQMLLGVTAAAMDIGYSVDVIPVSDVIEFSRLKQRLESITYCGAILADVGEPPVSSIMESMLPTFVCTHRAPCDSARPTVFDDFATGFDRLLDEFQERGHKRIAVLAQWVDDPTYKPFLEDFQAKMAHTGLEQVAIFHRNESLNDEAKDLLWGQFFLDAAHADACFSFVPNMVQEAREWLAKQGRTWEDELFIAAHSINSFPVDGCHLLLESELLEHGRAAVEALHKWRKTNQPQQPPPIPLRFVRREAHIIL